VDPDASQGFPYPDPDLVPDPENRELEGILWRLERFLPGNREVDWKESRRRNIEALGEIQRDIKSERLIALLDGIEYKVGGDEHLLFHVESDPGRVYKSTYQDSFGCRSVFDSIDPDLTGKYFNATLNDDPLFYLRRWILLNSLGGYKTRFEGILPPEKEGWVPRICVSQPWLAGENPDPRDISRLMQRAGFLPLGLDAFYLAEAGLLLTDAAPRNVRVSMGFPVPFDAIAEIASPEVEAWASTGKMHALAQRG